MNKSLSLAVKVMLSYMGWSVSFAANAQTAPVLLSPVQLNIDGPKGTLSQSVTTGTSASLSFGSTSSINVGTSLNSTSSTSGSSTSTMTLSPSSGGCAENNCINTRIGYGSETGVVSATMENLKDLETNTNTSTPIQIGTSRGQAELTGVQTSNTYSIDGSKSVLTVGLDTLHVSTPEGEHGLTQDGSSQVGSGSATMGSSTNMNVQINNSQFVNVFQQAF